MHARTAVKIQTRTSYEKCQWMIAFLPHCFHDVDLTRRRRVIGRPWLLSPHLKLFDETKIASGRLSCHAE